MRVVFWQNILSFYQVPHMAALAAQPSMEVVWVVREAITPDRVAQGWKVPEVSGVQVVVSPDDAEIQRLVHECPEDSVHIFSGIHQDVIARKAFYLCIKTSARIGLLNEAPFPGRLRDLVSPIFHWGHRLLYGRRISFILAMGHMAVDFYRSVGYSGTVVFPYGYFPDAPTHPVAAPPEGPVQIMYLGQLIERKGVDILLTALGQLRELKWHLIIVGGGDQKEALAALGKELGLEDRLTFHKSLENQAAMQLMEQSDFFVLPSRHDGWGVVVNEALLRGVPVICSGHCGASDLLKEPWRGETFEAGSASSLESSLRRWISHGKRTPLESEKIKNWSRCIERTAVSGYLLQIIQFAAKSGPRPVTPWLEASDDKNVPNKKSRSAE